MFYFVNSKLKNSPFDASFQQSTSQLTSNVSRLMQQRTTVNAHRAKTERITVTHLINKAACDVVKDFPVLYASFNGKHVTPNPDLILNVPVDIENHVEYLVIHRPDTRALMNLQPNRPPNWQGVQRGKASSAAMYSLSCRAPAWLRWLIIQVLGETFASSRTHYGNFVISNFGSVGVDRGILAIARPIIAALCFGKRSARLNVRDDGSYDSGQDSVVEHHL